MIHFLFLLFIYMNDGPDTHHNIVNDGGDPIARITGDSPDPI